MYFKTHVNLSADGTKTLYYNSISPPLSSTGFLQHTTNEFTVYGFTKKINKLIKIKHPHCLFAPSVVDIKFCWQYTIYVILN